LNRKTRKLGGIRTYSQELSIDLTSPDGRFKWFLASVLFARRISSQISVRTYRRFEDESLTSPKAILSAGWDRLVKVLDSGGYVRYDFSTASNLLEICSRILLKYGSLEVLHQKANSPRELETMLMEFRGVGPVCVNIYLRELRGIWQKADPPVSDLATQLGRKLGIRKVKDVESQLVRIQLEYCKKGKCPECPVNDLCNAQRMGRQRSERAKG